MYNIELLYSIRKEFKTSPRACLEKIAMLTSLDDFKFDSGIIIYSNGWVWKEGWQHEIKGYKPFYDEWAERISRKCRLLIILFELLEGVQRLSQSDKDYYKELVKRCDIKIEVVGSAISIDGIYLTLLKPISIDSPTAINPLRRHFGDRVADLHWFICPILEHPWPKYLMFDG